MSELRYVCKNCGKTYKILTWFNKHVEKYNHKIDPIELLDNNPEIINLKNQLQEIQDKSNQEITNLINRLNRIGLKLTITERKLQRTIESGISIGVQSKENTISIERIKTEQKVVPKTLEQINMILVIKELKLVFQSGQKLTNEKFSDKELGILTEEEILKLIRCKSEIDIEISSITEEIRITN